MGKLWQKTRLSTRQSRTLSQQSLTAQHRIVLAWHGIASHCIGIASASQAHLTPCSHPPPRRTRRHTASAWRVGRLMLAPVRVRFRGLLHLLRLLSPSDPPSGGFGEASANLGRPRVLRSFRSKITASTMVKG